MMHDKIIAIISATVAIAIVMLIAVQPNSAKRTRQIELQHSAKRTRQYVIELQQQSIQLISDAIDYQSHEMTVHIICDMTGSDLTDEEIATYCEITYHAHKAYELPIEYIVGNTWQESRFRKYAKSHVGARGINQIMPATYLSLCYKGDIYDIGNNTWAAIDYMMFVRKWWRRKKREKITMKQLIQAYNAGHIAVAYRKTLPEETVKHWEYVDKYAKMYSAIRDNRLLETEIIRR